MVLRINEMQGKDFNLVAKTSILIFTSWKSQLVPWTFLQLLLA